MHLTRNARGYTCTTCNHTGGVCLEALRIVEGLSDALDAAGARGGQDFGIEAGAVLHGCDRACMAVFSIGGGRVTAYCDVPRSADAGRLGRQADALLSPETLGAAALRAVLRDGPLAAALIVSERLPAAAPGPRAAEHA